MPTRGSSQRSSTTTTKELLVNTASLLGDVLFGQKFALIWSIIKLALVCEFGYISISFLYEHFGIWYFVGCAMTLAWFTLLCAQAPLAKEDGSLP